MATNEAESTGRATGTDPGPAHVAGLASVVARLSADPGREGANGVHWTLEDVADLNANLVHLGSGSTIASHRNDEVDVVALVLAGHGVVVVDGTAHPVGPLDLVTWRRGAERSIEASPEGLTYLTVHRRRAGLTVGRPRGSEPVDVGGDSACWAHLVDDETGGIEKGTR